MKFARLERELLAGVLLLGVVVDVTKLIKRSLLAILVLISNLSQAFAEMMAKGKTKVKTVFNFYHQNSNDGKQVFDNSGVEEVNVVEPMIFIEHQINKDTAITGHFVFDFWTAASDTKLDTNTGASGGGRKGQSRVSGKLGMRREVGSWTYGAGLGFSSEYDYRSLNGSIDFSRSFAKDNFTLGFGLQYYKDELSLFKDLSNPETATITGGQSRTITATALTASQILTKRDIIQVGLNYIQAKGVMESTASSVSVANVRTAESLPDSRKRYAISSTWVHGLSDISALNASYRYYWDKWDLDAHTVDLKYLREINDNEDFVEFFVRFHGQSKVKYFKESFTVAEQYMTSDSDLDEFSSYEAGIYHSRTLGDLGDMKVFGFDFENVNWGNSFVYNLRDNGMRYGYFQTAISLEF